MPHNHRSAKDNTSIYNTIALSNPVNNPERGPKNSHTIYLGSPTEEPEEPNSVSVRAELMKLGFFCHQDLRAKSSPIAIPGKTPPHVDESLQYVGSPDSEPLDDSAIMQIPDNRNQYHRKYRYI